MLDAPAPLSPPKDIDMVPGASPEPEVIISSMPGAYPMSPYEPKEESNPPCRLRRGRGGLWYLEARKQRQPRIFSGVVNDSDVSDDDDDDPPTYHPVNDRMVFDYRCSLNRSATRVEAPQQERKSVSSADAAIAPAQQGAGG